MTPRSIVVLLIALSVPLPAARAVDAETVLGADTWELAEGLLPEEILAHYELDEYRNPVLDMTGPGLRPLDMPPDFQAASRDNAGRFALGERGTLIESATGRQPSYVLGLPFPDVDAADPDAGAKIVWNYFYATWYGGDSHFLTELVMLDRTRVERSVRTEVWMRYSDGAPEARTRANPANLLLQTLAQVVYPADLAGITSLTWRFRDPSKHDAFWTYVPGLRRVRQVSALNRSDGFMGSDISLDEGGFFDGKPEDFEFRLLEQRDQLVLVDPTSVRGEADIVPVAGGGWRIVWKDVPRIGADVPGWSGVPWAPVSAVLVRRPTWIVEAVPRDPNYLFGRIILRFDTQTYHGSWSSKYDRGEALMISYQASRGAWYETADGHYISAGGVAVRLAENLLYDRATVVLFPPRNPQHPADYRVDNPAGHFTTGALMQSGR